MEELSDIAKEFLVESYENLDQLDRDLLTLEEDPTSQPTLARVFRAIHTIKGTCGFLGYGKLEKVAHVGESLLSRLRDGEIQLDPDITNGLLAMVDAIRQMLSTIETTGMDGNDDYASLVETLEELREGASASPVGNCKKSSKNGKKDQGNGEGSKHAAEEAAAPSDSEGAPVSDEAPRRPEPEPPVPASDGKARVVEARPEVAVSAASFRVRESGAAAPAAPAGASISTEPARPTGVPAGDRGDGRASGVAESTVRVQVALLDMLINLVGELVLARNQILQFTSSIEGSSLVTASQRLNLITSELQEGIMKTRMQPIGNAWSRFPRVVRDLARSLGKRVRVEMEGQDTELDKSLIEAIKDSLTHMVRNSVDHGIEPSAERLAVGKPAEGRLLLRAFHEGGQVVVEVSDDGGGINTERIRAKAVERGILTPEQAAGLGEREILNLIFAPGFSTAEKVTHVSGRGVGMDVVKTNVERINGNVELKTALGQGTTLRIKIPLTLAIIPVLIVTAGGDRYAIPQVSLVELVRLERTQGRAGVELIHGVPVYRLRGRLLPLVYLRRELKVDSAAADDADSEVLYIVVLQAGARRFGLIVDAVRDTQEIVVKPLGKEIKEIPVFAGATIMGDGRVGLILDVLGLAQHAHVVSEMRDQAFSEQGLAVAECADEHETLLLFEMPGDQRGAMLLSALARLERFPRSAIEQVGGREVVQYRGEIMPLFRVSTILGGECGSAEESEFVHVVVYTESGHSVGLVVDRIIDITHETVSIQRAGTRVGTRGTVVIQDRVTDLVDAKALIRAADAGFFEARLSSQESA